MCFCTYLHIGFTIGNISHVIIYLYTQPIYHLVYHTPTYGQGKRWHVYLIWVKTSVVYYPLCFLSSIVPANRGQSKNNLSLASPASSSLWAEWSQSSQRKSSSWCCVLMAGTLLEMLSTIYSDRRKGGELMTDLCSFDLPSALSY